ncbi:MAG: prepilin-type N-terminal cleavage/methylation domain-containing protein [Nitrospiraceae bacterium]|nr:prepilin-type N-terminal cleavage/methylation domain-containing protein [Nitrospiraceae bacterium]
MKRRKQQYNGFTLLELLIVLFLISVIIAISSVSLVSVMKASRLESAARNISATLRYARALAELKGRREGVLIDLDSKSFGIENTPGQKRLGADIHMKVIGPRDEEIDSGVYRISFLPSGAVDEGGSVIIWDDKRQYEIEPDPVTGSTVPGLTGPGRPVPGDQTNG